MGTSWDYDAIVIGSGFAGAVTACRLSEVGLRVCILERGRRYEPADLPVLPAGGAGETQGDMPDYTRALWKLGHGLWDVRDLGQMVVAQAAGFGGGSLIYANVHLRAPARVFDEWPDAYRGGNLDLYYDLAAWMLDVQVMPAGAPPLPKTVRFDRAAEALGRPKFHPPLAVNFENEGKNKFGVEQRPCDMRGECCFGCPIRAKNTLDLNYLHLAMQAENTEVRTLTEAISIKREDDGGGYSVKCRDHLERGRSDGDEISARYVFLCAGAVNTTELLMRSRQAGLPVTGAGLGSRFHPNADALAVAFDCDELQEADRGPTITSSMVYDDGTSWLLVQNGGLPAHLEPLIGLFRSPLWLSRNRFGGPAGMREGRVSQRPPHADLPLKWLVQAVSSLAGSAIAAGRLDNDHVQRILDDVRTGNRRLDGEAVERLGSIVRHLRQSMAQSLAAAVEPTLEDMLTTAAAQGATQLQRLLGAGATKLDIPGNLEAERITAWALTLGVQLLWGSQAGLVDAVAAKAQGDLFPNPWMVVARAADLLRWALDYRHGDGHAAILLTMGRDQTPWALDLVGPAAPGPGARIVGRDSGASAVLVSRSATMLVLTDVRGQFRTEEPLLWGKRAFDVCASEKMGALAVPAADDVGEAIPTLHTLRVRPLRSRGDASRSPRGTSPSAPAPVDGEEGSLRARPLGPADRPAQAQERVLRAIAGKLGGELRTDPLRALLDRHITVHGQGGCPMAEAAENGVADVDGEVFGCPGLYVMDAAAFPTSVGVNPSATILAVAERKMERFVRTKLGKGGWTAMAPRRAEATAWADHNRAWLDPIPGLPPPRNPEPLPEPIGIQFTEIMKGNHLPEPAGQNASPAAIDTTLTIAVPDLSRLLRDDREGRRLVFRVVDGEVRILDTPGMPADPMPVLMEKSWLRFARGYDRKGEWRKLEYHLEFDVPDGSGPIRHVLSGTKTIADDAGFDVWADTTTLEFTIARENGPAFRRGILRLPAVDFYRTQLPSFTVLNTDDPARKAWALASFARFFLGSLVNVYLPGLDGATEIVRAAAGRGHV